MSHPNWNRYTEEQWQEMIAAYEGGMTLQAAGRIHGADGKSLWHQMTKRGIPTRSRKATTTARNRTHGLCKSPLYSTWTGMKQRCSDPGAITYKNYGGSGVCVCQRWRNDFAAFLSDVGEKPARGMSIDRIAKDGHYSCGQCEECRANGWPMNVRWATQKQQMRNTSTNIVFTHNSETKTLAEWAESTGMSYTALYQRITKKGWDFGRAITEPIRKRCVKVPA